MSHLSSETFLVQCVDDGHAFRARLFPTRWNGWLCPAFDRLTAEAVVDWSNTLNSPIHLAWKNDQVVITDDSYPDEDPEIVTPVMHEGQPYWPIGAWSWVWELAYTETDNAS